MKPPIEEDDGWLVYIEVGEARTRGNIGREAGRLSGNKELSVKRQRRSGVGKRKQKNELRPPQPRLRLTLIFQARNREN